jgi:Fe-Mn family superoxide dismutase
MDEPPTFWNNLSPHGGSASLELEDKIVKTFGSFEKFKNEFVDCAVNAGCCGWAWLVIGPGRSVSVVATEKNQSPVMGHSSHKVAPLLVIDLWEHAYHDRYKNDKHAYLNAIWRMINWTEVSQRYERFS